MIGKIARAALAAPLFCMLVVGIGSAQSATTGAGTATGEAPATGEAAAGDTGAAAALSCLVSGYDLILRNEGSTPLPAGTGIAWDVRFARASGVHVLEKDLAPGQAVFLIGANGSSYLTVGVPCTVGLE